MSFWLKFAVNYMLVSIIVSLLIAQVIKAGRYDA